MEKVKFLVKDIWKTVKVDGQKVEVRPIITTRNMVSIISLCTKQFEQNRRDLISLPLIKAIYDMLVVHYCSNIAVEGIKDERNADGSENISVEVSSDEVNAFESSLALSYIKPYIKNYDECYELLLTALKLKNTYDSFVEFGDALPTAEDFGESLRTSIETLDEMKKENPDAVAQIAKELSLSNIRAESKKNKKSK